MTSEEVRGVVTFSRLCETRSRCSNLEEDDSRFDHQRQKNAFDDESRVLVIAEKDFKCLPAQKPRPEFRADKGAESDRRAIPNSYERQRIIRAVESVGGCSDTAS